eukprot:3935103-Rhodomonas_salina.1
MEREGRAQHSVRVPEDPARHRDHKLCICAHDNDRRVGGSVERSQMDCEAGQAGSLLPFHFGRNDTGMESRRAGPRSAVHQGTGGEHVDD